jgi:hypothetical protein
MMLVHGGQPRNVSIRWKRWHSSRNKTSVLGRGGTKTQATMKAAGNVSIPELTSTHLNRTLRPVWRVLQRQKTRYKNLHKSLTLKMRMAKSLSSASRASGAHRTSRSMPRINARLVTRRIRKFKKARTSVNHITTTPQAPR